jgi:hypothetical protein
MSAPHSSQAFSVCSKILAGLAIVGCSAHIAAIPAHEVTRPPEQPPALIRSHPDLHTEPPTFLIQEPQRESPPPEAFALSTDLPRNPSRALESVDRNQIQVGLVAPLPVSW